MGSAQKGQGLNPLSMIPPTKLKKTLDNGMYDIVYVREMKSKGKKTSLLTVRIPDKLKRELQALADAERRTLSQFVYIHLEHLTTERKGGRTDAAPQLSEE